MLLVSLLFSCSMLWTTTGKQRVINKFSPYMYGWAKARTGCGVMQPTGMARKKMSEEESLEGVVSWAWRVHHKLHPVKESDHVWTACVSHTFFVLYYVRSFCCALCPVCICRLFRLNSHPGQRKRKLMMWWSLSMQRLAFWHQKMSQWSLWMAPVNPKQVWHQRQSLPVNPKQVWHQRQSLSHLMWNHVAASGLQRRLQSLLKRCRFFF